MFPRLVHTVVVDVALLELFGRQFAALQSFAWARMLVTYSQEDGWLKGAVKTFDGL